MTHTAPLTQPMQVIDLTGNAYERGLEQGRLLQHHYEPMMEAFFTSELWRTAKPGWAPDSLIKWAFRLAGSAVTKEQVKKHLPVQAQRVAGIAEGLGIDEALCWGLHFLEILFCEAGASIAAPGGCTQVHATPRATKSGLPLSGRNYDFPNMLLPYQVMRREIPAEAGRLASTSATHIPLAGTHQGINEAGLLVACNNARLWRGEDFKYRGVPYQLIAQEILETCSTVEQAVEKLTRFPARANAGFMGFMDQSGDLALVEHTASRTRVRRADEHGVIAQTNHFLAMTEANLPDGAFWTVQGMEGLEYASSTKARLNAASGRLRQAAGNITADTLKAILGDHGETGEASDLTVCAHGHSGGTLSSFVADFETLSLWVCNGHPCVNAYHEVSFRHRPGAVRASAQKTATRPVRSTSGKSAVAKTSPAKPARKPAAKKTVAKAAPKSAAKK